MRDSYKQIKMSEQKKQEIIASLKTNKAPEKKFYVQIIAPLFVACIALFLVITLSPNEQTTVATTAATDVLDITHEPFFKKLLIYWGISLALLMLAYIQFLLLLLKPNRLLQYRLFRAAKGLLGTPKILILIAVPFLFIIAETVIVLLSSSQLVMELFVIFYAFLNYALLQLRIVKTMSRATCPYCEIELSTRTILLNKKCSCCDNSRVRKVQDTPKVLLATGGWVVIMLFPVLQLNLEPMIVFGILYISFTFIYILPYLYKYQKETDIPPALW